MLRTILKTHINFDKRCVNVSTVSFSRKISYIHNVGEEPLRYITVGQLLEETSYKFPERTAIISREQNRKLTFSEALSQSDRLANGLLSIGLAKNDRVGLWAPNLIEWYLSMMACARAGVIMVSLNPAYTPLEIKYCIEKTRLKAIICGDKFKNQDFYQNLTRIAPELPNSDPGNLKSEQLPTLQTVVTIGNSQKDGAFKFEDLLHVEPSTNMKDYQTCIGSDEPAQIHFSSGTTGKPKAAVLSHFNLVNNSFYLGKRHELNLKHHIICIQVPLFHVFGTAVAILGALNHGSTLVLPAAAYNPDKSLDALRDIRCTMVYGTPTMYVDLIQKQEARNEDINVEYAVAGGSLCTPHLFEKMFKLLKVKTVKSIYGLTETTSVVFHSLPNESVEKSLNTVGHIGEHIEAKVIDTNGNTVPFGTPGELCVRGYCNILGYWEDEPKTKELIGRDGWLKTGDQFVLDEDGYGHVVGRLKDMIIRGGENIFPKEIEDFINTHPNVLETQVIGLPHARLQEEVCACIRLKPDTELTPEDVKSFCDGKLARFKIPTTIKFLKEFPKTASGKIQKFKLKEIVLEQL